MTLDELHMCFAMVSAAWPHSKPMPETFALGQRLLSPLDVRAVTAAIEQFSLEGREFAPPLGLVAKRAHELAAKAAGEGIPDPQEALAEVYQRIQRGGFYSTPEWSHPAIGATVEAMGGWEATCLDENPEAFRAHFLRLYGTVQARTERESLIAPSLAELLDSAVAATALPQVQELNP